MHKSSRAFRTKLLTSGSFVFVTTMLYLTGISLFLRILVIFITSSERNFGKYIPSIYSDILSTLKTISNLFLYFFSILIYFKILKPFVFILILVCSNSIIYSISFPKYVTPVGSPPVILKFLIPSSIATAIIFFSFSYGIVCCFWDMLSPPFLQ